MSRFPILLGYSFGIAALLGCDREARFNRQQAQLGATLLAEYGWLQNTSKCWRQDVDLDSGVVRGYSDLGCFGLGNGRVFAVEGLQYPFGTLSNIFGPTYQKHQGSLGTQSVVLLTGGTPRFLPRQSVDYVLRSGIVHTRMEDAAGVRLDLYDCALPDSYAIVRVAVVTNGMRNMLRDTAVAVTHIGAGVHAESGALASEGPPRWVRIGFVRAQAVSDNKPVAMPLPEAAQKLRRTGTADTGAHVRCHVGTLRPGESVALMAYTIVAPSPAEAEVQSRRLEEIGLGALKETHDWWQRWYADVLAIETADQRINELVTIQQYLCRIQQAEAGGYSPMYMYTTCWVRDANGPVRLMTQSGKFDEVKRYLDYYYACCAQARRIPMNWPLDLTIQGPPAFTDWSKVPTERAEVPSFIILQHYWYWRQSGDLTPIKAHWDYLRRNLLGQQVDAQGRLPFHGDETYRFPGYQIFEATQKEPADWVSMDLLSADSAWDYLAAAAALRTWAEMLGKTDEASEYEQLEMKVAKALEREFWMPDRGYYAAAISDFSGEHYRYPFANIALQPLWLEWGVGVPGGKFIEPERVKQAALGSLRYLWRGSGTPKTTPGCGYYVGMLPGMTVFALSELRDAGTPRAIEGLLKAASPAGEYSEMNKPDDKPADRYWGRNRIRPWEGGINAEALVRALTGFVPDAALRSFQLDPSLPFGWDSLTVRNLRLNEARVHFRLNKTARGRSLRIELEGTQPVTVHLPRYVTPLDSTFRRTLYPGKALTFNIDRSQLAPDFGVRSPLTPRVVRFWYGEPTFAGKAKTVVVTWSKETFAAYRSRPLPAAIDTKIAFPPEYLAAALYDKAGHRRADTLILDVAKYAGHCKTAEFWTAGQGKRIVERFTALGGKVEYHPDPKPKPPDLFGQ